MTKHITRRTALSGIIAAAAATILFVAGCSAQAPESASSTPAGAQNLIAELGFSGKNAKDIITELDRLPLAERSTELMASIRPDFLVLKDAANREASVPMPEDEFYVSVAPYVSQTHGCHFHSLTTCVGELANQSVDVEVTNDATGEVIMKKAVQTYDNGFMGLWLPRGIAATLVVTHDGLTATQQLSTKADDDATCVTTAQLS
ncbi:CueP family metal-binding protein [Specibacter sp. NPDC078692]|uniref:CueP family metal-binding protein n=1 Tax=Specibacter sp. NPDC078692 TaxID=3155818 RepID=UPI00343CC933